MVFLVSEHLVSERHPKFVQDFSATAERIDKPGRAKDSGQEI